MRPEEPRGAHPLIVWLRRRLYKEGATLPARVRNPSRSPPRSPPARALSSAARPVTFVTDRHLCPALNFASVYRLPRHCVSGSTGSVRSHCAGVLRQPTPRAHLRLRGASAVGCSTWARSNWELAGACRGPRERCGPSEPRDPPRSFFGKRSGRPRSIMAAPLNAVGCNIQRGRIARPRGRRRSWT